MILQQPFTFDLSFQNWLSSFINPQATSFFKIVTYLGEAYILIVLIVLLFFFLKNKKAMIFALLEILATGFINQVIKHLLQRPRPAETFWLIPESGYSFPSFHAMGSSALFTFLIYLIWQSPSRAWLKTLLTCFLITVILVVSFSRLYLGVHYLSDVLGGVILGCLATIITIIFYKNWDQWWLLIKAKFNNNHQKSS